MQRCAECMPDSAKCRTAEQVPRAEERAFSFPASHSLAPCRSSKAGGGGVVGRRSGWLEVQSARLGCPVAVHAPGWPRAGSGSHQRLAVFTAPQ